MASELESVRDQRNITFELCAWGFGNVETFGSQMGHLWRTSQDITDTWEGLLWNIDVNDEVKTISLCPCMFGPRAARIVAALQPGCKEMKRE